MNYYNHHIGDYLRDTVHLSMLEDAAYRRMLDLYYASEKPLPLDSSWLCRLLRADGIPERDAVEFVLAHFFEKCEEGWRNKRADAEIKGAYRRAKAARTNGKLGGRPITQLVSSGLANKTQGEPKPKLPITNTNTNNQVTTGAVALPAWLPQDDWKAFEDSRKKLRKPMTDRARDLVLKKLATIRDGGSDPAAVLQESIRRGWLDIFPLKNARPQTGEVI